MRLVRLVLHLSGVRVGALAGDVAKLLALVAHRALVGLGALLGDVADVAAVVALDALGGTAGSTLLTGSTSGAAAATVVARALRAIASEVVATAGEALLGLTVAARSRLTAGGTSRVTVGRVGALAREVTNLSAVVALAGVRALSLRLLLGAIPAKVVARSADVARLARLGHFLLSFLL